MLWKNGMSENMDENRFHLIVGTKGQLIKMAPIMLEMDRRGIKYNFINAAQHTKILYDIIGVFGLKQPDIVLNNNNKDVANVLDMAVWLAKVTLNSFSKDGLPKNNDICLIHGDPIPASFGAVLTKLHRAKIAHIESGERTHNIFNPFPEELSRRMIDWMSDYLFTSSEESYKNLIKQGVKGEIVNLGYNTVIDAIRFAIKNSHKVTFKPEPGYVLVNVHRVENLYSKERLDIIISTIEKLAENERVLMIMHEPLKNKLLKVNMLDRLKGYENLQMIPLQDYVTSIDLIKNSKYIVNDGGAPQLESYFLSRPCLLMREFMEQNGYRNVCLSKFETSIIDDFMQNYSNYVFDVDINTLKSPSKEIVDILTERITHLKSS